MRNPETAPGASGPVVVRAEHGRQVGIGRERLADASERVLVDDDVRVDEHDHVADRPLGAVVPRAAGPNARGPVDDDDFLRRRRRRADRREAPFEGRRVVRRGHDGRQRDRAVRCHVRRRDQAKGALHAPLRSSARSSRTYRPRPASFPLTHQRRKDSRHPSPASANVLVEDDAVTRRPRSVRRCETRSVSDRDESSQTFQFPVTRSRRRPACVRLARIAIEPENLGAELATTGGDGGGGGGGGEEAEAAVEAEAAAAAEEEEGEEEAEEEAAEAAAAEAEAEEAEAAEAEAEAAEAAGGGGGGGGGEPESSTEPKSCAQ